MTRYIFLYRILDLDNITKKDKNVMESLATKGLTPVVLVSLINGSSAITNTVLGAIIFSVIISSVIVYLVETDRFLNLSQTILPKKKIDELKKMLAERKKMKEKLKEEEEKND